MTKEELEQEAEEYGADLCAYCRECEGEKSCYHKKDAMHGYKDGLKYGYQKGFKDCAKARLNVTTISDCPIKDEEKIADLEKRLEEEKKLNAEIKVRFVKCNTCTQEMKDKCLMFTENLCEGERCEELVDLMALVDKRDSDDKLVLLGERCNQLLKDKGDLTDKCRSIEQEKCELLGLIQAKDELIEKMKCCENCRHYFKDSETGCKLPDDACFEMSAWECKE